MNSDQKEASNVQNFGLQNSPVDKGYSGATFFMPFNPYMMMNRGFFVGNFQNQGSVSHNNMQGMFPCSQNGSIPRQFSPFSNINQFRMNPFPQMNQVFPFSHPTQSNFYQPDVPNIMNHVQRSGNYQDGNFWGYPDPRGMSMQLQMSQNLKQMFQQNQLNSDLNAINTLKGIKFCHDEAEESDKEESNSQCSCSQQQSENQSSVKKNGNLRGCVKKIRKNGKGERESVKQKSQYLIRKEKLKAEIALNGEILDMEQINDEGEEIEIKDQELKEIEEEIKEVIQLVKRRPKERRIRDVLTLIRLRNSIKAQKKLKYFKDAEKIMMRFGVSMKSFRDYNTELRIAEKFGFDIEKNLDKGFGIIREYNDLLLKENQYPKKKKIRREIRKKNTLYFNQEINAIQINEPDPHEEKRQKSLSTSSNCSESGSATALLANSIQNLNLSAASENLKVPSCSSTSSIQALEAQNKDIQIQIENF